MIRTEDEDVLGPLFPAVAGVYPALAAPAAAFQRRPATAAAQ